MRNLYKDHSRLLDQFLYRKRNQQHSSSRVETSNAQSSQDDYENVTKMSCRFHRQVTYDKQLQTYIFLDNSARVPAEGSMYVIFHEPTKDILDTNQQLYSLNFLKQKIVTGQIGFCCVKTSFLTK